MTTYRTTTDPAAPSRSTAIAPGLLLEDLEFALASTAIEPLSAVAYDEAVHLQREFLESVAENVAAMMDRGYTSDAVFAFLEPLLVRL